MPFIWTWAVTISYSNRVQKLLEEYKNGLEIVENDVEMQMEPVAEPSASRRGSIVTDLSILEFDGI